MTEERKSVNLRKVLTKIFQFYSYWKFSFTAWFYLVCKISKFCENATNSSNPSWRKQAPVVTVGLVCKVWNPTWIWKTQVLATKINHYQSIFKSSPLASLDLQKTDSATIMLVLPFVVYTYFCFLSFYTEKMANHIKIKEVDSCVGAWYLVFNGFPVRFLL